MQYKVYRALFTPILFFGVPSIALVIEGLISLFLGLFVSWYFIAVVIVVHIALSTLYKKNPFLMKVLILSVLKVNIKSDFVKGE